MRTANARLASAAIALVWVGCGLDFDAKTIPADAGQPADARVDGAADEPSRDATPDGTADTLDPTLEDAAEPAADASGAEGDAAPQNDAGENDAAEPDAGEPTLDTRGLALWLRADRGVELGSVITRTQVFVGRSLYGMTVNFDGAMHELVVYTRALSDLEIRDVERTLANRWACCGS